MRRLQRLRGMHLNAPKHSLPYQLSLLYLEQQSAAFKRMSVTVPPETILASLPPHVRVLSLQFSPDKCFLYCALVASGEKQYAMARMECTEPVMALLTQTQERIRRWRSASAKLLAEFEELHAGEPDFEFASTDSLVAQGLSSENDELEKEFSAIIVDTIDFFAPLFGHSALRSVLHSEIHGAAVTLLLDREIECLPVEALPVLEKAECITRDFSLHVLYQRLQTQKSQPFKRDDIRYIVDPYHDDTGLDMQTMETVLYQHVKRPGAVFTSWKDAVEHGQPPTTTDWQHALLNRRGGGLFYLGANRTLGSSLSMSDLLGMGTALNCHVICLLDRAENQASARRQSKVDSEKASWQLAVEEDAYANAVLWTLAGVNVLVMNQYTTTFNGNRRLASGLFAS
ncbi:Tetratricopeptide repeat protein 40, partial [Globisporangium polare]